MVNEALTFFDMETLILLAVNVYLLRKLLFDNVS